MTVTNYVLQIQLRNLLNELGYQYCETLSQRTDTQQRTMSGIY
jgi:hypothetical protein